jgi:hypothetical protein
VVYGAVVQVDSVETLKYRIMIAIETLSPEILEYFCDLSVCLCVVKLSFVSFSYVS